MRKFIASAIQMNSQDNRGKNLEIADERIIQAINCGASFIVLPECTDYCGLEYEQNAEPSLEQSAAFHHFSYLSKKNGVWIYCGSIHEQSANPKKPYNTGMLIGPDGLLKAAYRKTHLFDVNIKNGPHITESAKVAPGNAFVTYATQEIGIIGFSICYDLRFPELFRVLALRGAEIICVPASFAHATGVYHWEPLLRARAIENGCYVIAPGQIGKKAAMTTYGHSMIIDPWGRKLAEAQESDGFISAEIDLDFVTSARLQTGTLINRRKDLYS